MWMWMLKDVDEYMDMNVERYGCVGVCVWGCGC